MSSPKYIPANTVFKLIDNYSEKKNFAAMHQISFSGELVRLGMDTLTARERVTGNGPTHMADVRDTPTGTEENQITIITMKIVDNSTSLENGTTATVIQDLRLFVNMDPEL